MSLCYISATVLLCLSPDIANDDVVCYFDMTLHMKKDIISADVCSFKSMPFLNKWKLPNFTSAKMSYDSKRGLDRDNSNGSAFYLVAAEFFFSSVGFISRLRKEMQRKLVDIFSIKTESFTLSQKVCFVVFEGDPFNWSGVGRTYL